MKDINTDVRVYRVKHFPTELLIGGKLKKE